MCQNKELILTDLTDITILSREWNQEYKSSLGVTFWNLIR